MPPWSSPFCGLDLRLKALAGVGTADIQAFSTAIQFQAAFRAWAPEPYAVRAGFNLGFDFLLMPLYATSFYYSGIITAEAFAPRPGRLRRLILMASLMPWWGLCATRPRTASSSPCFWGRRMTACTIGLCRLHRQDRGTDRGRAFAGGGVDGAGGGAAEQAEAKSLCDKRLQKTPVRPLSSGA